MEKITLEYNNEFFTIYKIVADAWKLSELDKVSDFMYKLLILQSDLYYLTEIESQKNTSETL